MEYLELRDVMAVTGRSETDLPRAVKAGRLVPDARTRTGRSLFLPSTVLDFASRYRHRSA